MGKPNVAWQSDSLSPYGPFARVYDQLWGRRIRDLMLPVLEQLLLRRLPPRALVLDLCCGPAWISQALAERGFAVTGLDLDADMLALARANAPGCRLLRADARQMRLAPVFAGVLSTSDSLNHLLTLPEVATVAANVAAALVPGGLFCFDVLLAGDFQGLDWTPQALVEDDFVQVWRQTFDAAAARFGAEGTLFYRQDGGWRRWDTTDCEQLYTAEEIESALVGAGFSGIRRLSAAGDLGCPDLAGRTFFVAEKGPAPAGRQETS
jgi:SAM-dependent methyltransferase